MKNNTSQDYAHEGTIGSKRKAFKFSESAEGRAHLMTMLTDTYPDKELATIRELACNGRDAQIEAGYTGPIEVTTPEPMDPYLIVQDHGTGMSPSFIDNDLREFGTSTKRHSDDYTGFFGIGSKAPLTLVEQFTFYSVRNGVKTAAHVARGDDGNGGIEIIDTVATDEPNGTRFKIAVDDIHTMRRKVHEFFRWWPEGSVLIDGEEPERPEPYIDLDPWIKAYKKDLHSQQSDIILMGGVPYPVPTSESSLSEPLGRRSFVVVEVPMGSVEFTTSRQELRNTELTLETLNIARAWIKRHATNAVQEQIDKCESVAEVVQLLYNHYGHYNFRNEHGFFTYKGVEIPYNASVDLKTKPLHLDDVDWEEGFVYSYCRTRGRPRGRREQGREKITSFSHEDTWVIEGHTNKSLSLANQNKIDRFAEAKGLPRDTLFYLVPKVGFLDPWAAPERTVHWKQVAQYKAECGDPGLVEYRMYSKTQVKAHDREAEQARLQRGRFYRMEPDTETVDEAPAKGRLIYYSWTDDNNYNPKGYSPDRLGLGPGILRVIRSKQAYAFPLSKNRWSRFIREYPRAKHISEVLQEEINKFFSGLSKTEMMILSGGERYFLASNKLRAMADRRDEVLDPILHEAFDMLDSDAEVVRRSRNLANLASRLDGVSIPQVPVPEDARTLATTVNEAYPFLKHSTYGETEHAIEYVNALYLHRNPDKKEDADEA